MTHRPVDRAVARRFVRQLALASVAASLAAGAALASRAHSASLAAAPREQPSDVFVRRAADSVVAATESLIALDVLAWND
jgi:hypothetical protein